MRFTLWFFVSLLFAAATAGGSAAQQVRELSASADTVSVGDRFSLSIIVDRPADSRLLAPDPLRGDSLLGDLVLLRPPSVNTRSMGADQSRDSLVYEVTTFAIDSAVVPPQSLRFVSGADTRAASSPPLLIPVRSLVPPDADEIQDIAPIVEFPRPIWPWILAILLAIALAVLLYLYTRRRAAEPPETAPAPPPVHPYEEAVRRLDRLADVKLDDPVEHKPFYVEVSDILRTYLEHRIAVPALEQTTRELMRDLERRQMDGFPSTAVARIRPILEESDLVKFADARLPSWQGKETASATRRVIDEIEEAQRKIEASSMVREDANTA